MLTTFPKPYPDELLYSVITRYHIRTSNSSPKWTLRELFGTDRIIPTFDLPSHLEHFSKVVSHLEISLEDWIDQYTLYPLYAPFLPENRAVRFRALMKKENGSGIHAYVGITASIVGRKNQLTFCPSCYEEDIKRYGEPYWHRIHQVPGVFVCPFHKNVLLEISEPVVDRHGLTILPISKSMFTSIPTFENVSAEAVERLCELASDLHKIMRINDLPSLYYSKQIFLPRLNEMGMVTASSRVRQRILAEQFKQYYGDELLKVLESSIMECHSSWITFSTRKERRVIHPIRQMLLISFLYGSFDSFVSQLDKKYAPFGNSPWPCLNKAAAHYREPVVQDCLITRCSGTGCPVGTFSCGCGFVYSRRGPDVSAEDRYKRGRIKAFGPVWFDKLQSCLKEGLSYRAVAKILGVDTNTVIKYSLRPTPDFFENTGKMRKSLKKQIKVKVSTPAIYQRVDWEKRDLELSWRVEEECSKLLEESDNKPIRITIGTIGKRIGKSSWLQKCKQKLPITMAILSKNLETDAQFQIRRIRWAVRIMKDEWPLKRWKIEKMAGLRPGYGNEVLEEINRCIGQAPISDHLTVLGEGETWVH